eukprot:SAG31_NODE_184_length_20985_cov_28.867567_9_plen_36_part_00
MLLEIIFKILEELGRPAAAAAARRAGLRRPIHWHF